MSLETFRESKAYKWTYKVISFLIGQWFSFSWGFIALAHSYPEFAKQGGTIRAEYSIGYGAVAVIFLISGLSMSTKQLLVNVANWSTFYCIIDVILGN